ncbi:MAG: hypothetical protein ACF8MF_06915 [Phycisphaerales bacterium JB052]
MKHSLHLVFRLDNKERLCRASMIIDGVTQWSQTFADLVTALDRVRNVAKPMTPGHAIGDTHVTVDATDLDAGR